MPRKIAEALSVRSGSFWQKEMVGAHDAKVGHGSKLAIIPTDQTVHKGI
jgi:hypothetical protein